LTIGSKIQGTLTGSGTRTSENSAGSEKKRYASRITQQTKYGVVFWGFHVDDPYNQEGGVNMPDANLPAVSFEFLGDSDIAAPPPEFIDVEISSCWSLLPKAGNENNWLPDFVSRLSQTASYSNLCQMVALSIPSNLPKQADYRATLNVYPRQNKLNNTSYRVDTRRQVGSIRVTPKIEETGRDFNFAEIGKHSILDTAVWFKS